MKSNINLLLLMFVFIVFSSCYLKIVIVSNNIDPKLEYIYEYNIVLFDTLRERHVPINIYTNKSISYGTKVVIFNHGYDQNKKGSYRTYSKTCSFLAKNNYFIISIQHDLPNDQFLAMEGDLYKNRMPSWEKGVYNIFFVIEECKKIYSFLDWTDISLIGHSNGGDIIMLFINKYPELIKKAISLDNRRMLIPRLSSPRILSLRGNDFAADPNVIPTISEQRLFNIKIVYLKNIKHGDMDDKGTKAQNDKINNYIIKFLNEEL